MALMASYALTQKGKTLLKAKEVVKPEVLDFLEAVAAKVGPEWHSVSPNIVNDLVRFNYITRVELPKDYKYPDSKAIRG